MEFRMAVWLLASMALGAIMFFWHKKRSERAEQVGSSDDFSNITLYFDPIKGEGHLFLGGTMIILTFSMFVYELAKVLVSLFGID